MKQLNQFLMFEDNCVLIAYVSKQDPLLEIVFIQ